MTRYHYYARRHCYDATVYHYDETSLLWCYVTTMTQLWRNVTIMTRCHYYDATSLLWRNVTIMMQRLAGQTQQIGTILIIVIFLFPRNEILKLIIWTSHLNYSYIYLYMTLITMSFIHIHIYISGQTFESLIVAWMHDNASRKTWVQLSEHEDVLNVQHQKRLAGKVIKN